MPYPEDLIALVDQRIQAAEKRERHVGNVVDVDTTGPGGMVLFDGSTTAMPVKIPASVFCQPSHRVMLEKFGSDWLVTGAYVGPGFGEASRILDGLPGATGGLTAATFVDLQEFGTFAFSKIYDATFLRIATIVGGQSSGSFTRAHWALRLTPTAGGDGYTPTDIVCGNIYWSAASVHLQAPGAKRILGVPAGTYQVSLRWRRVSGTGTITADHNDHFAVELDERVRATNPIL